jgi:sulfur carrier protein
MTGDSPSTYSAVGLAQKDGDVITINQRDELAWREDLTVQDLLDTMSYTFPRVIVTIDGVVVPHDAYAGTQVPDEADVRVIHLMAGG